MRLGKRYVSYYLMPVYEQWFWVVDRAMYAAKEGGRNQVRLAIALAA